MCSFRCVNHPVELHSRWLQRDLAEIHTGPMKSFISTDVTSRSKWRTKGQSSFCWTTSAPRQHIDETTKKLDRHVSLMMSCWWRKGLAKTASVSIRVRASVGTYWTSVTKWNRLSATFTNVPTHSLFFSHPLYFHIVDLVNQIPDLNATNLLKQRMCLIWNWG